MIYRIAAVRMVCDVMDECCILNGIVVATKVDMNGSYRWSLRFE